MAYNIDKAVLFILYGLKNRSRETGLMYLGCNEVSLLCLFVYCNSELSPDKMGNFIKCGFLMSAEVCKQRYLGFLYVVIVNGLVEMLLSVPVVG